MTDRHLEKRSLSPIVWVFVAVVLAAIVALFFVGTKEKGRSQATAAGAAPMEASATAEGMPGPPAAKAAPAPTGAHDAGRVDRTERIDAAKRVLLLSAIAKALAEKSQQRADGTRSPAGTVDAPYAGPPFEMAYLRERFEEDVLPLLRECYVNARAEDPSISGDVTMRWTVVGDEGLGGLITDVEILDATLPEDASLVVCARESLYALRLKAPKGRGSATFTQSLTFAQRDGGED